MPTAPTRAGTGFVGIVRGRIVMFSGSIWPKTIKEFGIA
jgi:hypothetical protein